MPDRRAEISRIEVQIRGGRVAGGVFHSLRLERRLPERAAPLERREHKAVPAQPGRANDDNCLLIFRRGVDLSDLLKNAML